MKKLAYTVRALLFQLHLYVGLAIGVYVAILGLTGAILAFEPEIEHLADGRLLYVQPRPHRLSFAELGAALARAYPAQRVFGYNMGASPDRSTWAVIGTGPRAPSMQVYLDPYTGQILGSPNPQRTVLSLIANIHVRLAPPRRGHGRLAVAFVNWITVAALLVLLSGIYLWWPQMRFGIGAARGRRLWRDLHITSGIVGAVFLVLLAASGIVIGFGNTTRPLFYALTGSKPEAQRNIAAAAPNAGPTISLDQAFAIARTALPGAQPLSIFGPTAEGVYVVVARAAGPDVEARSRAVIDQHTGAVLYSELAHDRPAGERLWHLNQSIHFGDIFGMASQVVMGLASLLVTLQALSGVVMWVKRPQLRGTIGALVATAAVTAMALYAVLAPNAR